MIQALTLSVLAFIGNFNYFWKNLHTANVLSVEYTNVCLCSKFKYKHWLFLYVFICNRLQLFSCCFYTASKAKSTGKLAFSIKFTKDFLLFQKTFFTMTKTQFLCCVLFIIFILKEICLWLKQHSKISENRCDCLEITDKNLSLSVIELFTFAVYANWF